MAEQLKSLTTKERGKEKKEKRVNVEEIENGYLITQEINWQDPKKGYQWESKKWYSKTNPFEETSKSLADLVEE